MTTAPVIAVDGPSGTGKGTLCLALSEWLGWNFLDSGALYRVLALAAVNRGLALDATDDLAGLAACLPVDFRPDEAAEGGIRIILDGHDVTGAIRTEECGSAASQVAALPAVRAALLEWQRAVRRAPGLVADGRDMGTVVFPDADLKIFLTASAGERARRRYNQLKAKGNDVSLPALLADIAGRDERDRLRAVSPLVPAADAVVFDTTECGIDEVVERAKALVRARGLAR
jgi:cytidylate kinase